MRLIILTAMLIFMTYAGCTKEEPEPTTEGTENEHSATIESIEQSGQLWGIDEVRQNKNGSVTLVDAKNTGNGFSLMMSDASNNIVDSINLKVSQTCTLMDGHHVFITYELKDIKENKLTFMVIDKFDARAFGDDIKVARKTLTILPYTKRTDSK